MHVAQDREGSDTYSLGRGTLKESGFLADAWGHVQPAKAAALKLLATRERRLTTENPREPRDSLKY